MGFYLKGKAVRDCTVSVICKTSGLLAGGEQRFF